MLFYSRSNLEIKDIRMSGSYFRTIWKEEMDSGEFDKLSLCIGGGV